MLWRQFFGLSLVFFLSKFIFMIAPALIYEAIAFSAADPALPAALPLLAHLGLILLVASLLLFTSRTW